MTDINKIGATLKDYTTNTDDMLVNIAAVKGKKYAAFLAAVSGISNMFRTTNAMSNPMIPDAIHEMVVHMQVARVQALIEPFFADIEDTAQRHAACNEFYSSMMLLGDRRALAEQQMDALMLDILPPKKGDSNGS